MAMVLFGDGYLEVTGTEYRYYVPIEKFRSIDVLDRLEEQFMDQQDGHVFLGNQLKGDNIVLRYAIHEERTEERLDVLKSSLREKDKDELALKIITIVETQYNEGFFVLPIPINFVVDRENNQPRFIYKAVDGMPITGFGFSQMLQHLKRLISFLYVEQSFEDLLLSKDIETDREKLISISNSDSFSELKLAIQGLTEKEEIETDPILTEITSDEIISEAEKVVEIESQHDLKASEKTEKRVIPKKSVTDKQERLTQRPKILGGSIIKLLVILIPFLLLLSVTTYLTIDKITYPSQVSRLKKEVEDHEKTIEQQATEIKKVKSSNESMEKDLEKNEGEIDDLVKSLKDALNQNKKLREELQKNGI